MSSIFDSNSTSPPPPPPATRYRALNPLAFTSVVLGALSILAWLHWAFAVVPLAGLIVGWVAWKQIRKAPEEWTGKPFVIAGVLLSALLWLSGCIFLTVVRASEIPYGYDRITYAMLQPDPMKPTEPIPQAAIDMVDRKVYMQGYMQLRRTMTGIKEFILCPTNGDCPFCTPSPRPTEKVKVILQGDLEATYVPHQVGVAGHFRIDRNNTGGIPYQLEADYLRQ
ncbi:MAG: DUF4190 domain-containing protein [Thermoguttaceae bacterium]